MRKGNPWQHPFPSFLRNPKGAGPFHLSTAREPAWLSETKPERCRKGLRFHLPLNKAINRKGGKVTPKGGTTFRKVDPLGRVHSCDNQPIPCRTSAPESTRAHHNDALAAMPNSAPTGPDAKHTAPHAGEPSPTTASNSATNQSSLISHNEQPSSSAGADSNGAPSCSASTRQAQDQHNDQHNNTLVRISCACPSPYHQANATRPAT
jgi:hypothetical protein